MLQGTGMLGAEGKAAGVARAAGKQGSGGHLLPGERSGQG